MNGEAGGGMESGEGIQEIGQRSGGELQQQLEGSGEHQKGGEFQLS